MELSKEAYHIIVKYVGHKSDLCALARVSKSFQPAAERALYNTIYMRDAVATVSLCQLLSTHSRLSIHVEALTVFASDDRDDRLPENYWSSLSHALKNLIRLRFFNLHIDGNAAHGWILNGCVFKLRAFHCDLVWDADLVSFLNEQHTLEDLYIADYGAAPPTTCPSSSNPPSSPTPEPIPTLDPHALCSLSTLECSFAEAVCALAPGRPVARLKTCFSRERIPEKQEELAQLLKSLRQSRAPIRALDLADSAYAEDFSLNVLAEISRRLPDLRYLGTLVLPVGKERLQFFGMLMRLRKLHTIELEVSDWDPQPMPQALRALASEIRLYCSSILCVVFVQDFSRTVVRAVNGICVVDSDANTDNHWSEV